MSSSVQPSGARPNGMSLLVQMRPALLKYFLRKTGSAAEAEDLTQDVLVRSLTHSSWKSLDEAKGYLFRSAVNRWRDRRRRQRVHTPAIQWSEAVEEYLGTENPPERVLIAREELNQIFQALEQMNERTRTVLMLIRIEQMKVATVADMLGISVRAANKHLAKGVEILMRLRKRQEWLR
jgi:RNA polymerase sigma factor (sigma-70 family)